MRDIFEASDGNYGVPRMRDELRHAGLKINHKRARPLMRLHGMAGRCRRRRCRTTFPGPDGYVIADLIGRRFELGKPDTAWCQDITYIPTGEGWLYLASVLDLGSLVTMAVAARGGTVAGVIAHADRGSQPSTPPTTTSSSASDINCAPRSAVPGCAGTVMMLGCFSGRPDPCYDRPWCPCVDVSVGRVAHRIRLLVGRADGDLIGA
jgi:hypothetical protein